MSLTTYQLAHDCVKRRDWDLLRELLETMTSTDARTLQTYSELPEDIISSLKQKAAKPEPAKACSEFSALELVMRKENLGAIELLLKRGAKSYVASPQLWARDDIRDLFRRYGFKEITVVLGFPADEHREKVCVYAKLANGQVDEDEIRKAIGTRMSYCPTGQGYCQLAALEILSITVHDFKKPLPWRQFLAAFLAPFSRRRYLAAFLAAFGVAAFGAALYKSIV
jgi:hypothetical protein